MPRPYVAATRSPYDLLNSLIEILGSTAVIEYVSHQQKKADAPLSPTPAAPKKRKKRADAGKPRLKKGPKSAKSPKVAAPVKPKKPVLKRAKPRVDPLNTVTHLSQEGAV